MTTERSSFLVCGGSTIPVCEFDVGNFAHMCENQNCRSVRNVEKNKPTCNLRMSSASK